MRLKAEIKKAVEDFTLEIRMDTNASRIGILGPSGSGKSMTLRCIAGIETPDSGRISLDDRVLYDSSSHVFLKPQQRNVGYMFQNYALFPTMTVLQNLECGVRGSRTEKRERALEMLSRMKLDGLENRFPSELSGGQQQRTALGRILAGKPELILLDEPYSALDPNLVDRLQREMEEILKDYNGQVIMVSHNRDDLYRFSEELFVIREGSVLCHDRTKRLFDDPRSLEAAKITGCKNFSRIRRIDAHRLEASDWGIELKVDRPVPESARFAGYRAHYLKPVWGDRKSNCMKFRCAFVDDMLFEKKYYCIPETGCTDQDKLVSWFVQAVTQEMLEERGMPDYLEFEQERILLLE